MSTSALFECHAKPGINRDFFLIHTIYGISLILGFEQLGEAVYSLLLSYLGPPPRLIAPRILLILLSLALALLGVRFFWVVDNVFRYIDYWVRERKSSAPRRQIVAVHFPILFLHSFVFFCLCRLMRDLSVTQPYPHPFVFLYAFAGLLLGNAAWLLFLVRRRKEKDPERWWIINNSVCGLTVLCFAAILRNCGHTVGVLWFACAVFLANNLVDLIATSRFYIEESEKAA